MLDKKTTQRITDFVRQRPRTVQEIAFLIERNWRTAESYVERISVETGLLATRTFREGTRGALKIVYWNALDPGQGSAYQERLLQQILVGREKHDFSPFDIYQFTSPEHRSAVTSREEFGLNKEQRYDNMLAKSKHQLLFFSGNLSWISAAPKMLKVLENAARRNVSIKIITRVDITSMETSKILLAINKRVGHDAIEIRHCEQPLRAGIIDDSVVSIKEVFSPLKTREVKEKFFLFYRITDPAWIQWLQKVFWQLWNQSVDAQTRIDALATVRDIGPKTTRTRRRS